MCKKHWRCRRIHHNDEKNNGTANQCWSGSYRTPGHGEGVSSSRKGTPGWWTWTWWCSWQMRWRSQGDVFRPAREIFWLHSGPYQWWRDGPLFHLRSRAFLLLRVWSSWEEKSITLHLSKDIILRETRLILKLDTLYSILVQCTVGTLSLAGT